MKITLSIWWNGRLDREITVEINNNRMTSSPCTELFPKLKTAIRNTPAQGVWEHPTCTGLRYTWKKAD